MLDWTESDKHGNELNIKSDAVCQNMSVHLVSEGDASEQS